MTKYTLHHSHFYAWQNWRGEKTAYGVYASKENLFEEGSIDLVMCFSPSLVIALGFSNSHWNYIHKKRFCGGLGSSGNILDVYHSMQSLRKVAGRYLEQNRVFCNIRWKYIIAPAGNVHHGLAWGGQSLAKHPM